MDGLPSFDDTDDFSTPDVPEEGRHNVSIKNMEYDESSSGNDMLVATLVIDSGKDARMQLTEYLVMGHESGIGESRLKSMATNTRTHDYPDGFEWSDSVSSWDEFAGQFVQSPPLRFGVELAHEYSIETERGWKNDVTEEKYRSHVDDGGKGRISAEIVDYYEPNAKSEIPELSPGAEEEPSEENGFPEYEGSGDGAPGPRDEKPAEGGGGNDDDGLPF